MSYRDYLDAQKKYIQTKKEARQAKEEDKRNPQPPRRDPPPAPTSKWFIVGLVFLMLLPLMSLIYVLPKSIPADADGHGLTVWVSGTEQEYLQIKNWLEPEILANDLEWTVEHLESRQDLLNSLATGSVAELLIIQPELAEELYYNQVLTTLWNKREGISLENTFFPFWSPQPFRKTVGWAIPKTVNVDEARHLFTVIHHFATPFNP